VTWSDQGAKTQNSNLRTLPNKEHARDFNVFSN